MHRPQPEDLRGVGEPTNTAIALSSAVCGQTSVEQACTGHNYLDGVVARARHALANGQLLVCSNKDIKIFFTRRGSVILEHHFESGE
jgi:hypothetical protein